MKVDNSSAPPTSGKTRQIVLWALGALLLMAVLTYVIISFLAWASGRVGFLNAYEHPRLTQLLSSAIPAAALLAAAAAGAVGILRQRSLEVAYDLDRERHTLDQARSDAEAVARLRDRYATAASQLGNEAVAVRLAGVYAVAALADDWLARANRVEAQVCIDLLCSYFRLPSTGSDNGQGDQGELAVRDTITRVIAAHLQDPDAAPSWSSMNFDFTGATFQRSHSFNGIHLTAGGRLDFSYALFPERMGLDLQRSKFSPGSVLKFEGADLRGSSLSFAHATFAGGEVSFKWATLSLDPPTRVQAGV